MYGKLLTYMDIFSSHELLDYSVWQQAVVHTYVTSDVPFVTVPERIFFRLSLFVYTFNQE